MGFVLKAQNALILDEYHLGQQDLAPIRSLVMFLEPDAKKWRACWTICECRECQPISHGRAKYLATTILLSLKTGRYEAFMQTDAGQKYTRWSVGSPQEMFSVAHFFDQSGGFDIL